VAETAENTIRAIICFLPDSDGRLQISEANIPINALPEEDTVS
jgi:hypothetical protein